MNFVHAIREKYQIVARSELKMFYHGTSSKYLKSILKHGLLPETKEGVWKEEDPNASPESPSRKSYGGVYWSNNTLTSLRYGNDVARKFGGNPIVVMALLQLKTALPDEDDFHGIVTRALNSVWGKDYRVTGSGKALLSVLVSLYQNSNDAREIEKNFISTFIEDLGGDSKDTLAPKVLTSEFKKALIDLLQASVIRRITHEFSWENEYDRMVRDLLDKKEIPTELKLKSVSEGESLYRDALSMVLNHARRYVLHSHWNKTLRVTEPVGFSGRNRIVCIVEVIQDGDKYKLKLHYGKKIPDEWLKDFKAQWSSNVEVI
jgi:hypothetical protein